MKKDLMKLAGIAVGLGVLYYLLKDKKEEKKSNAIGENCNRNQTNRPCWEWVRGKGQKLVR